ncbi:MAG: sulfatase-like hydrolase/transferase [Deltaproteobacteria bacterium]|nr:sulfatase-like hydrolase/transferase [Deltaproteobacteria bacterium]
MPAEAPPPEPPAAAPPAVPGWRRLPSARTAGQILGLALAWAALAWWVQHLTTAPGLWKHTIFLLKDRGYRFLLDLLAGAFLLGALRTRYVALLMAVSVVADGAILSYFTTYRRALSWVTVRNQAGEGAAVFGVAFDLAAPYLKIIVPVSLAVLALHARLSPRWERRTGLLLGAASVWLAIALGLHLDHKPLYRLRTFETADGIAHTYGYAITWAAETLYIDQRSLTKAAIEVMDQPADRLVELVPPQDLGRRLAVVQVESLDDALVGFRIGGRPVTPRLDEWAARGTYLRVQAPKRNGSCDSDFSLLMGTWPSTQSVPYRLPAFPFERSIIGTLRKAGVSSAFYHGVDGAFFERRRAFAKMGFDRVAFREEVIERAGVTDPEWTLPDGVVLRLATKERRSEDAFFEFSITGTSHTPFEFSLEGMPRELFPGASGRDENYFDTIRYVDGAVGAYVDGLPPGTVVLIYGDHWSQVENASIGYRSQVVEEFGVVPLVLFRTTAAGPEPLFTIDPARARSAELRLVDVARWYRRSLESTAPAAR